MKRFFLVWIMMLAGLTNYSNVSDNDIDSLIIGHQENTFGNPDSYDLNREDISLVPIFSISEELFTIPPDGTIFVSQLADVCTESVSGGITGTMVVRFGVQ